MSIVSRSDETQKFDLIWLDSQIDRTNLDDQNTINHLEHVANRIHTFTNVDDCIQSVEHFIDNEVCMIISGALGRHILHRVHDMLQVNSIFIFCANKKNHELWVREWPKIKGVFTDIISICDVFKQTTKSCKVDRFVSGLYRHNQKSHIDQTKDTKEGLISFHNFLSTTRKYGSSVQFAYNVSFDRYPMGNLFVITIGRALFEQPIIDMSKRGCVSCVNEYARYAQDNNQAVINIYIPILLPKHSDFPKSSNNNIGNVHNSMKNYPKALSYHEKTPQPRKQSLPSTILLWCVRLGVIF